MKLNIKKTVFLFPLILMGIGGLSFWASNANNNSNPFGSGGSDHSPTTSSRNISNQYQSFVDTELSEHFGQIAHPQAGRSSYYFNAHLPASVAFQKACPNNYNSFRTAMLNYNKARSVENQKTSERSIRNSRNSCAGTIFDSFNNIYQLAMSPSIQRFKSVSEVRADMTAPSALQNLWPPFSEWDKFYAECVEKAQGAFYGHGRTSRYPGQASLRDFGSKLSELKQAGCFEQQEKFTSFFESLDELYKKAEQSCRDPQRPCIATLSSKINLNSENSLFKTCLSQTKEVESCCAGAGCEYFSNEEVMSKYNSQVQPFLSTGNNTAGNTAGSGNMCQANSPAFQRSKSGILSQLNDICKDSTDKCAENCLSELEDFKRDFLSCFALHSVEAMAMHEGELVSSSGRAYQQSSSQCEQPLKKLRLEFSKAVAQVWPLSDRKDISLALSSEALSSSKSPFLSACDKPYNDLKTSESMRLAKVGGIFQQSCSALGGGSFTQANNLPTSTTPGSSGGEDTSSGTDNSNNRYPSSVSASGALPSGPVVQENTVEGSNSKEHDEEIALLLEEGVLTEEQLKIYHPEDIKNIKEYAREQRAKRFDPLGGWAQGTRSVNPLVKGATARRLERQAKERRRRIANENISEKFNRWIDEAPDRIEDFKSAISAAKEKAVERRDDVWRFVDRTYEDVTGGKEFPFPPPLRLRDCIPMNIQPKANILTLHEYLVREVVCKRKLVECRKDLPEVDWEARGLDLSKLKEHTPFKITDRRCPNYKEELRDVDRMSIDPVQDE